METKDLILRLLDACVYEAEDTFKEHYEYWNAHIESRQDKEDAILEVLAQEAQSRQSTLRQTCLVDIIRWGVIVDKRAFSGIAFHIIRQELADLPTRTTQLTEKNESGMYIINAIMHLFDTECQLAYETEEDRNKFMELAYQIGKFVYADDEEENREKEQILPSYYWLDCAVEKIIYILAWFAHDYRSEKALICLKDVFCDYPNASWLKKMAIEEYTSVWRYLNITYEICYNQERIILAPLNSRVFDDYAETATEQESIDFSLYSSDNQWLRLLKNKEHVVLFYQDKDGIVYHSQNIDAPDDVTLLPFVLRDNSVVYLPITFKIYYHTMDWVHWLFHDLISKGEVHARKKRKRDAHHTLYFGLEKCEKNYLVATPL